MAGRGSVRASGNFNANQDAETLYKAMKGLGTDEDSIMKLLTSRSNSQRQQIKAAYKTLHGKDLVGDLQGELGGKFETLVVALMTPPILYDVTSLRNAIKGAGTDEKVLIEILSSRTAQQIKDITAAYRQEFDADLEEDVTGDTSGHFRRLLVILLQASRQQGVQEGNIEADAQVRESRGEGTDVKFDCYTCADQLADHVETDQLADHVETGWQTMWRQTGWQTMWRQTGWQTMWRQTGWQTMWRQTGWQTMWRQTGWQTMWRQTGWQTMWRQTGWQTMWRQTGWQTMWRQTGWQTMWRQTGWQTMWRQTGWQTMWRQTGWQTMWRQTGWQTMWRQTDRLADHVETDRLADHVETDRLADHVETDRLADHVETDRLADHVETDQLADHSGRDQTLNQTGGDTYSMCLLQQSGRDQTLNQTGGTPTVCVFYNRVDETRHSIRLEGHLQYVSSTTEWTRPDTKSDWRDTYMRFSFQTPPPNQTNGHQSTTMAGRGSVRASGNFNANQDAETLYKAMKGLGTDEDSIMKLLTSRSNSQRQQIKAAYKTLHGKDLVGDLQGELGGKFETLIVALMTPPILYDVTSLRNAIKGAGTDEKVLIEILSSRTAQQIKDITAAYRQEFNKNLEEDVTGDTSGHFRRLLVILLQVRGQ
ncbi:uncharacterized protein LOC127920100, partial [Oncorhynchus keta]|uniref:uncharacterized protein LOC127920100 n=1 Tax=Oncorhynchus keta TaxID=8018 RepID=UPI00227B7D79